MAPNQNTKAGRRGTARQGRLRRWAAAGVVGLLLAAAPAARAEDEESRDARLEGYAKPVAYEKSGNTGTYMLWGLLTLIAAGVMFKSANRSHLD